MVEGLSFVPVLERPDLVSASVLACVRTWSGPVPAQALTVAEIDPAAAGGQDFCARYGVPYDSGANCVVVEARRNATVTFVACLIPVGCRMDLGGFVRRHLGARRVSVADKEFVLTETGMEYGSITPFGLPKDWRILADSRIVTVPQLVIGGGLKRSKLRVPGAALLTLPNAESIENLGIPEDAPRTGKDL